MLNYFIVNVSLHSEWLVYYIAVGGDCVVMEKYKNYLK